MSDVGLTHIALPVTNMEASLTFYATYARMQVVHHRTDPDGTEVVWLSDRTRTFVIDALCEHARQAGCLRLGPTDSGYPIGYWAFLSDPDGHTLEIAHGQEVALTVAEVPEGDNPS